MPALPRPCTVTVFAVVLSTVAGAHAAETSAIGQAPVDRMIDLNRRAFVDINGQRFSAAKYWLDTALVISETAGLDSDPMTARTYVHLAVVQLTGFADREEAVRHFELALEIDPNITITPGLDTPALKAAYLEARERLDLPPKPDRTVTSRSSAAKPAQKEPAVHRMPRLEYRNLTLQAEDPDLPARIPAPLLCIVPFEIPRGKDFLVRCVTHKHQKRASATLYYRPDETSAKYVALPMGRSPKGWLRAIIPARNLRGKALAYYVKAHLPGSQLSLYSGYPETPIAVLIKGDASADTASAGVPRQQTSPTNNGHRRAPGSFWIGLGFGTGAVYHAGEPVDSKAGSSTGNPVHVEAGFTPAGLLQVEPELGYQLTPRLSLSLMMRWQYAPLHPASATPREGERTVLTSAVAGFARAQLFFGNRGNLQPFTSLGVGLGRSFLATIGKRCPPEQCSLDHSDTLHGGPLGLLASVGILYHLTPRFAVAVDIKEIVALPKVMALTELNVGLQGAHNFGAGARPARPARTSPLAAR